MVRSVQQRDVVVHEQPNNGTARAMAAAGNPIVVRRRNDGFFSSVGSGAMVPLQGSGDGGRRQGVLSTLIGGFDVGQTFWIPDAAAGEVSLLEHLHRRGATNRSHVLLQSRPLPELQFNFSTCTGANIDLSHNIFRLSKAAMAMQHMDATLGPSDEDDNGATASSLSTQGGYGSPAHRSQKSRACGGGSQLSISTRAFKATMRASLQSLQEEDYYLVKYRDYSTWAVTEYRSICKSDSIFGRKYIEQCFAVHVGREPGELIPITEAQFWYGVDLMQRQLMNELRSDTGIRAAADGFDANHRSYAQYQIDVNYSALNADQYRSLGALLGDGMRQVGVEAEERQRKENEMAQRVRAARGGGGSCDDNYTPPAWYDWSPGAIRARVQHRLHMYYRSVGQLTIQLAVLGVCGWIVYRSIREYIPGYLSSSSSAERPEHGKRRGGSDGDYRGRSWDRDDNYGYQYRPGFFRSLLMGPKDVFDYMLAPAERRDR